MGFKMKSGMKPSFKMMGSTPVKQYADKNVSVDKVSDDGRTFTGTDSKGNTAEYLTNAYDAEVMQSDSVGVTGNAVSNMQMEYDMVKGTEYEQPFIDYHGKGDKPGTGKTTTPAKQVNTVIDFDSWSPDDTTDTSGDGDNETKTKTKREPRGEDTRTRTEYTSRKSPDYTIVSGDGKTTTRNVTKRGGTKTIKLEDGDGEPTVKVNKRGKKTTTPAEVHMTKTKRSGKVVEKDISRKRAERMRRRGRNKGQEFDEQGGIFTPLPQQKDMFSKKVEDIKLYDHSADIANFLRRQEMQRAEFDLKNQREQDLYDIKYGPSSGRDKIKMSEINPHFQMPISREEMLVMPHSQRVPEVDKSPLEQTSHGPIKEYQIPMNPNEGPYIVRARKEMAKRQADMNYDGPDYRHIRERRDNPKIPWNPGQGGHDGPHPERPLKQRGARKRAKQTTKSDIEQAAKLGVNLDYDKLYPGNLEIERQKNQMVKDLNKKKKQNKK